jgi:hypothetical protein
VMFTTKFRPVFNWNHSNTYSYWTCS